MSQSSTPEVSKQDLKSQDQIYQKRSRPDLAERNRTHGLSRDQNGHRSRLYGLWIRMRQRCRDPNSSDYERYGGRGIKVCSSWSDYKIFHDWAYTNGYNDKLTIDRIDNNAGYGPENCQWISCAQQATNKRTSRRITFRGETRTLSQWSRHLNIQHSLLRYRIDAWGVEEALARPVRRLS